MPQPRDDAKGRAGKRGSEDMPGMRRHFTWQHEDRTTAEDGAEALQGLVMLALVIPLIAVGARRLHDTKMSGCWQLFWFLIISRQFCFLIILKLFWVLIIL